MEVMPDWIATTIAQWVAGLDYEYMLLHVMVSYGLYYSPNMAWLVRWMGGRSRAVWRVGLVLALVEIGRQVPFLRPEQVQDWAALVVQKTVSIGHSYLVIQVFVEDVVCAVNGWLKLLRAVRGQTGSRDER